MIISPANRVSEIQEYYFSGKLQQIADMNKKGADVINLGIGSPDLAPASTVIESLYSSSLQETHHGYQGYKGTTELRNAIANFYANTYNVEVNPHTEILPLLGSKEGIAHISWAFLNEGDTVLIPELGYPAYSSISRICQAKIIYYPLQESNWQPDWEILKNILAQEKNVKLLWLNYPNMPTGAPADYHTFKQIVELAFEYKFLVCHDNPYSLVLNREKPLSIWSVPQARQVAIELNSMSKSHNMAGWRVGWLIGSPEYITTVLKIKSNIDSGMFRAVQDAAIEALQLPLSWHQERNSIYAERKKALENLLNALGCSYQTNQEGLFVWAKLPENIASAVAFVDDILEKHHVFLTPGSIFGTKGERYIRVSLCATKQRIEQAIKRIRKD